MPGVDVLCTDSILGRMMLQQINDEVRASIKASFRRFGVAHFSVADRVLNDRSFSFKFAAPEPGDDLTSDFIVRTRLHGFDERRDRFSDATAEDAARAIAEDLKQYFPFGEVTVGVELMLAGVGLFWGSASTFDD